MYRRLLQDYSVPRGRYDELLSPAGTPRPHWEAFMDSLARRDPGEVNDTLQLLEREIRESGITYNVYADPQGTDRAWQVDPLPLLIAPDEWQRIEAGIAQRAALLNRVLADVYGPQELLASGAVPAAVVFGHSGYLHQLHGARPPDGVHLFVYAADLARSPDGRWWVVNDRTQAPSGAGYALENRLAVSRVFPQMFSQLHVQHLASFFNTLRDSLLHWAPSGGAKPLVALLTPGPYNETYSEHALLARYLGFALVEGSDLTVRDGRVWLKTVEGLQQVHVLLRRQDDDYCDPLELRSDSALGIAGLVDCVRRGSVLVANALGAGVLESGALLGYLPRLARELLGEPLLLPSVATWWLGEEAAFRDAWRYLDRLMIKPLDWSLGEKALFGIDLAPAERVALHRRVAAHPQRYVAQEWVRVSQAPVLDRQEEAGAGTGRRDRLSARTMGLRVFAVATPSGWHVMPGGLTRVAGADDARVIAMQRGGRSKDTWVLNDGPVNSSFSLLTSTVKPQDLVNARANVTSRAAENLFWFGRYGERCEATARLLRVAISTVLGDAHADDDEAVPVLALARRLGLLKPSDDDLGAALLRAATDPQGGLAQQLGRLAGVAFSMRDRMSGDNWRTLNQLTGDALSGRGASLPAALAWLDRVVTALVTLSGYVLDGMTRGTGWRFLSLGRRIERLAQMCGALDVATDGGRACGLDWLLAFADSTMTYRSRYTIAPEWLPVLDLLVRDEANPRSVAFQVKGLADYVDKLERAHGSFAGFGLGAARYALAGLEAGDLRPESPTLRGVLQKLQETARGLSDELTLRFFTHSVSQSVFSAGAGA